MASDLISLLALFVSLLALWRSDRIQTWLAHMSDIVSVEGQLRDIPQALRFHGITEEEVEEAGLTPTEFAYLLNSFTLGSTWDRSLYIWNRVKLFGPDRYRYRMCESPATQRAWPVVRKMMNPSPFVTRMDRTIRALQEKQERASADSNNTPTGSNN